MNRDNTYAQHKWQNGESAKEEANTRRCAVLGKNKVIRRGRHLRTRPNSENKQHQTEERFLLHPIKVIIDNGSPVTLILDCLYAYSTT